MIESLSEQMQAEQLTFGNLISFYFASCAFVRSLIAAEGGTVSLSEGWIWKIVRSNGEFRTL
jgi:hypothetical protein